MNEPYETAKISPSEPNAISPEILEKFSNGNIQLTPAMAIIGEPKDRKLHINISRDDPSYIAYNEDLKLALKFTETLSRRHKSGEVINDALDLIQETKKRLPHIQTLQVKGYISAREGDFSARYTQIPNNGSQESVRLKEELDSEYGEFRDLSDYINHLVRKNAVTVTLPEQKPTQEAATGKTEA